MRILSVSDVIDPQLYPRADKERLGPIDLVLGCGDLPPEYLSYLTNAFDVPLFYVKGNHDIRYRDNAPLGCCNIHERVVSFRGLKLMGLEGSMWYNGGPYQYTEKQMARMVRRMRPVAWWRGGVDIVITHAPPQGIHDGTDLCHRGFECYRRLIQSYRPAYFIHGHIHRRFDRSADRKTRAAGTTIVNTYGHSILEFDHARLDQKTKGKPGIQRSREYRQKLQG
ncbi:MAG: metallophosphoesterase [Desulfobacterales bacterium]|jgi:Icc-related predicted phosphoesterase